ncbi:endonuclease/exonuclease/phosphatase family protein [Embleya sp. NPDC059237]|uniref:endonuclease/exonuclease/phosphatase family protein n=1 Tax=Embleya sp. NPDC059237 TaxID=3346784 RepID=UPI0036B21C6A
MTTTVDFITCNFENNGGGDRERWQKAHEFLAWLRPAVLCRQEMWDALDNDGELAKRAVDVLGMRGWVGRGSSTALYADPSIFEATREWSDSGWQLEPTAHSLRLRDTGGETVPIVAVSHHLTYSSPTDRAAEGEHLTRFLDKGYTTEGGATVKLPAILGGDRNSYTVPIPGGPLLPDIESFTDRVHQAHRSRRGPDGTRIPDTHTDREMLAAGAEDAARHIARTHGRMSALAPTVIPKPEQGGATAVDGFWVSTMLLPALRDVDVIDMTGLSDHHAVRAKFHRSTLADILRRAAAPHLDHDHTSNAIRSAAL